MNENLKNISPTDVIRFTFSAPVKGAKWKKISANRLADGSFQVEKLTEKQAFHEKIKNSEKLFEHEIFSLFGNEFLQMEIYDNEFSYNFRAAKKRILFNRKRLKNPVSQTQISQNRSKNYILNEGMKIMPLVDLGVFHPDFTLIKKSSAKFKQINRFVEFADDLLKNAELPTDRPFTVVDFGCGKSYLTFILYYYFTEIRRMQVKMIGMDLKEDVIAHCNQVAEKYGYENLTFQCGDIGAYSGSGKIDMIVTLHACDTATDYALFHAVNKNVKYILSVPCCQHELNKQFKSKSFSVLADYGLIQERFCTLLTDTIRAELLKSRNYNVQIMEFVDLCHTPKNAMIRAELTQHSNAQNAAHLANVKNLMQEFSLSPTLYELLEK